MGKRKGKSWIFESLPNSPQSAGKEYWFYIGPLEHIDKKKLYLCITEHPNRSAEGRPLYPEQEAWVRDVLKEQIIQAKEIWFSTWEFKTEQDASTFTNILNGIRTP